MSTHQSKIEKLIAELAPNGVEFKELGELGYLYGGLTGKSKEDFSGGNASFVTYVNIYNNIAVDATVKNFVKVGENEKQNRIEYGDVLFTGSSETPDDVGMSSVLTEKNDEPLYLNSFCFGFRFHDANLFLPGFTKYLFRDEQARKQISGTASGVTRFNISKKRFAKIKIPLPPLTVQKEIVKILDTFTQLEAELAAELAAELEARRKQYEHYRSQLLTFDDVGGVRWTTLNEIAKIKNGKDWKKLSPGNIPVYGTGGIMGYVDRLVYDKPTVLIPRKGSITNIFYIDEPFWNVDTIYYTEIDTKQVIPKFFYYFMKTIDLAKLDTGSGRPSLTQAILDKIKIPVPPLAEQERIVSILDKFDVLVNNISVGLPAELNARRSQYEYYRNKLLTFTEA